MNRYQDIVGRINYGLFLVVVFLLPFPQIAIRVSCVAWIIMWFFEGRWLRKPKSLKENKMAIPFILFAAWYAWKLLSVLWAPDYSAWAWEMERYMAFGLMLPIGIWGVNEYYDWRTIGKALILGCVLAVPMYLIGMVFAFHHQDWMASLLHVERWWTWTNEWGEFLSMNLSWFKHRLFLCSVEILGVIAAYQIYRKKLWILIPSALVMLSSIPLTGSRQSVLTCAAMLVIGAIYALPKRYRIKYGVAILVGGMLLGGGLLTQHPRMQDFEWPSLNDLQNIDQNAPEIRFNIWSLALEHPEDYMLKGLGAGQSMQYMQHKYHAYNLDVYAYLHFHAHNQYLEELMEIGIFGLLLFIAAWLVIPFCAKGLGRQTAVMTTTLFILNMQTDCMFGKFCGIALWAACLIYVLLQSNAERKEQPAGDTQTH